MVNGTGSLCTTNTMSVKTLAAWSSYRLHNDVSNDVSRSQEYKWIWLQCFILFVRTEFSQQKRGSQKVNVL